MSVKRLEDIAEELLTERKILAVPSAISLHKTIDELLMELALQEKYPNLTVQKNYHTAPFQISAEKNDLKRAFTNIITNAVEAMRGNGDLTIITASDGNSIRIDIKDTGPGMTPEILEKVLQGGFTYNKTNGNGIGMTVVREVIEKCGGNLTATSAPGKGTIFHIQIPLPTKASPT
ncbi:MAG: HAMP domain-containing histidine kinase [Deltaproteobacteria bacterium]|nr:HAMP domain-containing histidine kinase [Deltaproteobacteria bacterium]